MRSIHLILTTNGNELGCLPLPGIAVAAPLGNATEPTAQAVRPQLIGYIDTIVRASDAALAAEGLTTTLTVIQLRLAVADALAKPLPPNNPSDEAGTHGEPPVDIWVPVVKPQQSTNGSLTEPPPAETIKILDLDTFVQGAFDDAPDIPPDDPALGVKPDAVKGESL